MPAWLSWTSCMPPTVPYMPADRTASSYRPAVNMNMCACAAAFATTALIVLGHSVMHLLNYTKPAQQKLIIRILFLPLLLAVFAFATYIRPDLAVYFVLARNAMSAIPLCALLLLFLRLLQYDIQPFEREPWVLQSDRAIWPLPVFKFGGKIGLSRVECDPDSTFYQFIIKFGVLQYCLFQPLLAIAGIVAERLHKLCQGLYSVKFAALYLFILNFISISFAWYGLEACACQTAIASF
jgi:hypothetical protein